jgi:isoamylase
MPVHEFNELEYFQVDPHATHATPGRYNFWGYSTVGYFAPMARYSAEYSDPSVPAADAAAAAVHEFKTLVKEAHRRGIEVILDVVFNHTAEGNENGLVLSFRGIDNRVYYMLAPGGECYNYSGCGNTFNCNHPVARQFILDCLRYWVEEMHVDGFRFDLASIMTRAHSAWHPSEPQIPDMYESDDNNGYASYSDEESPIQSSTAPFSAGAIVNEHGHMTDGAGVPTGTPLPDPPLIAAISSDPVLSTTKLIAEAWDCDGLNQVGGFPHYGGRWSEWNGHFRDAVRQFIKGTDGAWAGAFASALCGSPGIYAGEPGEGDWWGNNAGKRWKGNRGPTASVNFITAHDGFTLADLVSYNEKHNEANGEENRDGESHNLSWNCGEEGPTLDVGVLGLRCRQQRNMLVALFLAHGVPMLLCGDEYGHSKGGNNNTYCHDSDLNYFDWSAAAQDKDGLLRFTRHLIALRRARRELRRTTYVTDDDVEWHGIVPGEPDWSESSRLVAFTLKAPTGGLYVAFNTSHSPQMLALPRWEGRVWQPVIDTSKAAPFDVLIPDARLPEVEVAAARAAIGMWTLEHAYPMLPWSCIVLESVPEDAMENMPTVLASSSTSGDVAVAKGRTTKPRSTRRKKGASGEVRKAEEQALQ